MLLDCKREADKILEERKNVLGKRRSFLIEYALRISAMDQRRRAQAGGVPNGGHGCGSEEASLSLVPSLRVRMMEEWAGILMEKMTECLCQKASNKLVYEVEALLERCPQHMVNIWDKDGKAPLHKAVSSCPYHNNNNNSKDDPWLNTVKALCDHPKIDLNRPTKGDFSTPLHLSVRAGRTAVGITDFLLQRKADPCGIDIAGFTVLHVAAAERSIATVTILTLILILTLALTLTLTQL